MKSDSRRCEFSGTNRYTNVWKEMNFEYEIKYVMCEEIISCLKCKIF